LALLLVVLAALWVYRAYLLELLRLELLPLEPLLVLLEPLRLELLVLLPLVLLLALLVGLLLLVQVAH
jgi:hypothetical protein